MTADPLFYCGVAETVWNRSPVSPGSHTCVSPVYGRTIEGRHETRVRLPSDTLCIQDSGAFSDGPGRRLDPRTALERQQAHSLKYGYETQVTHRASYDFLIDESWTDGNRFKRRWSVIDAEEAVDATIEAAEFMAEYSDLPAILSAQGVDADQYFRCTRRVAPFLRKGDVFGLGGFCVTGKMPAQMMPVFQDTFWKVIPWIATQGVKRVHIFGVIYAHALGQLLWLCDQHDIALSTDSIGPNLNPIRGEWGYANWRDPGYVRPPVERLGADRARHVALTREWIRNLRQTRYYRQPHRSYAKQLFFLSDATP